MIGTVGFIFAAGIASAAFYHGDYQPLKQNVADNTCSRVWGKFHNEQKWVRNAKAEVELEKMQRRGRASLKTKDDLERATTSANAAYQEAISKCPKWARQRVSR